MTRRVFISYAASDLSAVRGFIGEIARVADASFGSGFPADRRAGLHLATGSGKTVTAITSRLIARDRSVVRLLKVFNYTLPTNSERCSSFLLEKLALSPPGPDVTEIFPVGAGGLPRPTDVQVRVAPRPGAEVTQAAKAQHLLQLLVQLVPAVASAAGRCRMLDALRWLAVLILLRTVSIAGSSSAEARPRPRIVALSRVPRGPNTVDLSQPYSLGPLAGRRIFA